MLNFRNNKDFSAMLRIILEGLVDTEKYLVEVKEAVELNTKDSIGIVIRNKQEASVIDNICLTEKYYEAYRKGKHLEDIVDEILEECLQEVEYFRDNKAFVRKLMDFEAVKEDIVFNIVGADVNKAFLDKVPHMRVLDMAVYFYVIIEADVETMSRLLVTNELLNVWGVSQKEIIEYAVFNTPKQLPADVFAVQQIMETEISAEEYESDFSEFEFEEIEEVKDLYVISNTRRMFGAGAVLYARLLEGVAETLKDDIILIPWSVHEMIAVPYKEYVGIGVEGMREMIRSLYMNCDEDECLTYTPYVFFRESCKLDYLK